MKSSKPFKRYKNYGISYLGSKSKILHKFCGIFPPAENFYDLFGGGFSVTHFMIAHRSKAFKQFHFNEIRPDLCGLIQRAIRGEFSYSRYKPKWVSREDFFAKLDTCIETKILWSFGNKGKAYLFGDDIADYKRSLHQAVIFDEFDDTARAVAGFDKWPRYLNGMKQRRLYIRRRVREIGPNKRAGELEQLERLERLQRLQRLQRLEFYSMDYKQVPIKQNSVIYCDIPYQGTAEYDKKFDHNEFFGWAAERSDPVFISEYEIKDRRFHLLKEIEKKTCLSGKRMTATKPERIYCNAAAWERLNHASESA